MDPSIVPMVATDAEEAIALWRETEGIGLSGADTPAGIRSFLARNPGLSFVARVDGVLAGVVLCGHDGRRGYIHHLAIRPSYRGMGVGSDLAERCLAELSALGIGKCHLFVQRTNPPAFHFWRRLGWKLREDLWMMSKEVDGND